MELQLPEVTRLVSLVTFTTLDDIKRAAMARSTYGARQLANRCVRDGRKPSRAPASPASLRQGEPG